MCECVCVWVLREGFGPNWHRQVKCSPEPSWHPCTSKCPIPNKRSGAWMRISLPTPEWLLASQCCRQWGRRQEDWRHKKNQFIKIDVQKVLWLAHNVEWLQGTPNPNKMMVSWFYISVLSCFSTSSSLYKSLWNNIKLHPYASCSAGSTISLDFWNTSLDKFRY